MEPFWVMVALFSFANLLRVSFKITRRKRVRMELRQMVKLTKTVTRQL